MPNEEPTCELRPYTAEELHEIFQARIAMKGLSNGGRQQNRRATADLQPHPQDEDAVDLEEICADDNYFLPNLIDYRKDRNYLSEHPNEVIEAATQWSVKLPEITCQLAISHNINVSCCLSDLQMQTVNYACQIHEQLLPNGHRAGFLLGDGAGMGKGRILAAIIFENYKQGRKRALWVSLTDDVQFNIERDILNIKANMHIKVTSITNFPFNNICSNDNDSNSFKKGIIYCTYSEIINEQTNSINPHNSRVNQLAHWLGKNGVIVLDECHMANKISRANTNKFIKTCTMVLKLQQLLPMARIVYASATGAAQPRDMVYMVRLGLWGENTSYSGFFEFVNAMNKRGCGTMELIAADMKMRGMYISRHLSYRNVKFRIEVVNMAREFRKFYNYSTDLWSKIYDQVVRAFRRMCIDNDVQEMITRQFWYAHYRYFKYLCVAVKVKQAVKLATEARLNGKSVVIGIESTGECKCLKYLEHKRETLPEMPSISKAILESFIEKYFPAPSSECFQKLLSTGYFNVDESATPPEAKRPRLNSDLSNSSGDDNANENDDSAPARSSRSHKSRKGQKTVQQRILKKLCNNSSLNDVGDEPVSFNFDEIFIKGAKIKEEEVRRSMAARDKFVAKIEQLGLRMPANSLDKLLGDLGGPEQVAEITYRTGRIVKSSTDDFKFEVRGDNSNSLDMANYHEKRCFMKGIKLVAIISELGSSGTSLHSDSCVPNQRRRLYISLELPWSVDRAMQQFGCVMRTNQVNDPEFIILVTDQGCENYMANTLAKHLKSLGAKDTNNLPTDLGEEAIFNVNNRLSCSALDSVIQQIAGQKPIDSVVVPELYEGDFITDCCESLVGVGILSQGLNNIERRNYVIDLLSYNITDYLDRLLGCRIEIQDAVFRFFITKLYALTQQVKRTGDFDLGIIDLTVHEANVTATKLITFKRKLLAGSAITELHTIEVERGMTYEVALALYKKKRRHSPEGFYMLKESRNDINCAILCLSNDPRSRDKEAVGGTNNINLKIYRANTGAQVRTETFGSIDERYVKISKTQAKQLWDTQYNKSLHICAHIFWTTRCPFGKKCELGLRVRTYHVLSGLLIPIWERIAAIIYTNGSQMRMVRIKINKNRKIAGILVPQLTYRRLVSDLSCDSKVESNDVTAKNLNTYNTKQ